MSLKSVVSGLLLIAATVPALYAGSMVLEPDSKKKVVLDEFPYTKGTFELEIDGGGFGSVGTIGDSERPDVGYAIAEVRVGYMLSNVRYSGILRGNYEFLFEAFGGGIFEGPGDFLVGFDLFVRYNFVQPESKIVPFIQIGAGGVYSDAAANDATQHLIGGDIDFVLEAEIGVRYHVSRNVAITTALEYRHISNADFADRNRGLNSLGGTLGVSMFF